MATSVYLFLPAYPLTDRGRSTQAITAATQFAQAVRAELVVDPACTELGQVGAWGHPDARRAALRRGLAHTCLLAGRGGYGCLDLLDEVQNHQPLPYLVGYSDVTVLHAAWRRYGAVESCYGFMPGVSHGERALLTAVRVLSGEPCTWTEDQCPEVRPLGFGHAQGWIFAGCLSVLCGLIGTPWFPSLSGAILCIEDIDERPYRIDRMLWQLHAAGCLTGVVGLVTNSFPAEDPSRYAGPSAADIITNWSKKLEIPAIFGLPFGHHADPIALPCGRFVTLTCTTDSWSLGIAATHS